jgi:hypothetical protein
MVGDLTWSSSASSARVIQSSTQVSKEDWRDDMEFFCITCKSNKVLYSGDKGFLETSRGVLLHHLHVKSNSPLR